MKEKCIRVSIITLIINVFLSFLKILSGIVGKSSAMISDGVHSLSDILSTVIVIIGLRISNKASDKEHQYGHERFENVASIILSFLLFITGMLIGIKSINNIYNKNFIIPTNISLIAAIISILVKEWMYHYTMKTAKKYSSDSLKADAWHHRSDALSSIISLLGIIFTIRGLVYMDLIASIVITIIIIAISIKIFIDSINKMLDKSCSSETEEQIKKVILSVKGVEGIDLLKTRQFGNKIYVDLEINANKNISFEESHKITHKVHDKVEKEIENIKHVMIHINPK